MAHQATHCRGSPSCLVAFCSACGGAALPHNRSLMPPRPHRRDSHSSEAPSPLACRLASHHTRAEERRSTPTHTIAAIPPAAVKTRIGNPRQKVRTCGTGALFVGLARGCGGVGGKRRAGARPAPDSAGASCAGVVNRSTTSTAARHQPRQDMCVTCGRVCASLAAGEALVVVFGLCRHQLAVGHHNAPLYELNCGSTKLNLTGVHAESRHCTIA